MSQVIIFKPLYMERVWGGRSLEHLYGRELPNADAPFGESWEVVDREDAQSVVDGGEFDGLTLHELWTAHRAEVFGTEVPDSERFPLLLKVLDARQRMSIQVHPPEAVAGQLGGEPKTEMWYIAAADPDASVYAGLKRGVSREDFERGVAEGRTEEQVHRIEVNADEFIFIPSGRLHAIGAGLLIHEIQQNSDTTYRVFDWNRVGLDGKPRDLHVAESLQCIDFADTEPGMDQAEGETLVNCQEFHVDRWSLSAGESRACGDPGDFAIISVVEGTLSCGETSFTTGDFFLIPANAAALARTLYTPEGATLLRTTLPS